jgi:broad specificity phosphatase PhoE
MEITIVRHGQSESNAAGLWQGQHDSPLTEIGRAQASRLAQRLAGKDFDLVVASDLSRASDTAAAVSDRVEIDKQWRELDLGEWESKSREHIEEHDRERLEALRGGEDVPLGGGERLSEFHGRIGEAFERLRERADVGSRVLVVAHGGVIAALTRLVLDLPQGPPAFGPLENTSLTRFRVSDRGPYLLSYNDASHLGPIGQWARGRHDDGDTLLTLFRHGQTHANVEDRWQGVTDGALTLDGRSQAQALAGWYPTLDVLYASPLQRAQHTAEALADALGIPFESHEGVIEMHLGEWEDRLTEEIREGWAELWRRIYHEGHDLPRGGSGGEALSDAATRMQAALLELSQRHAGARVGVVTHGGAIRSYALDLLGVGHAGRDAIDFPDNTSATHVVIGEERTVLADYNVAPHLD